MKSKRCANCGAFDIVKRPKFGPFQWRDFPTIYVSSGIDVYQCSKCNEELGTPADSRKIDGAIEETIKRDIHDFIDRILKREQCLKSEIAQRAGITPEYLSNLIAGSRLPSFQVYNFLKTMAFDARAFQLADPRLNVEGLRQAAG